MRRCARTGRSARRYRCQAVQTFGSGYAFMCNYGWTDHIEGQLTFSFRHWDGNPREVLKVYSKLARAFAAFEVGESRPEVALVFSDARFAPGGLGRTLAAYRRVVEALSWWGVGYSVVPESARAWLPADTRLVIDTEQLAAAGLAAAFDEDLKVDPRKILGDLVSKAGVAVARQAGDASALGVFRIPTKEGGVAWAFWNPDCQTSARVTRNGQTLTIGPDRAGLMRFGPTGELVSKDEL